MKKLSLLIFLFVFTININAQNFNIVDYFRLLPDSVTHGYPLTYENNKWKSKSSVDYPIYPTVDIKNGFIEIIDEGTGGGTETVQVALFRTQNKRAVIAVSYSVADGIGSESTISFWKYSKGYWIEITDKTLPDISLKNFTNKNYTVPKNLPKNFYDISFSLPHYGTILKANLFVQQATMFCNGSFSDVSQETQKMACDLIKNIKTKTLELHWDKNDEKFVF